MNLIDFYYLSSNVHLIIICLGNGLALNIHALPCLSDLVNIGLLSIDDGILTCEIQKEK